MREKVRCLTLCALLLTHSVSAQAQAQQPTKIARIGYLTAASGSDMERRTEPLRQGLRELGYIEGKNIAFVYRTTEGKSELHRETRRRAGRSQSRYHRHRYYRRRADGQESYQHHTDRDDDQHRSRGNRTG